MIRCFTTVATALVSVAVTMAGLAGCGDDRVGTPSELALGPAAATLPVGRDLALTTHSVLGDGRLGGADQLAWTSSDDGVARVEVVDGRAAVHGLAVGSTVITATGPDGIEAAAMISVGPAVVDGLALEPARPTIPVGLCTQATVTASMSDGTTVAVDDFRVAWSVERGDAAVSDGRLCGLRPGTDRCAPAMPGSSRPRRSRWARRCWSASRSSCRPTFRSTGPPTRSRTACGRMGSRATSAPRRCGPATIPRS